MAKQVFGHLQEFQTSNRKSVKLNSELKSVKAVWHLHKYVKFLRKYVKL